MIEIRRMAIEDYDLLYALFQDTPGICLRAADSREATARYLARNPGLSFVAFINDELAGCIICGHDGRRGYLQHLLVRESCRRQGVARELVGCCVNKLASLGILKSHIEVLSDNQNAQLFWESLGWQKRQDIYRYSFIVGDDLNV